jgi:hypothetical protein
MPCRSTKRLLLLGVGFAVILPLVSAAALVSLVLRALDRAIDQAAQDALAPAIVLLDFSEYLAVGNKGAAYSLTSEDFQRRVSREDFSTFVDQHPDFSSQWVENKVVEQTAESVVYEVSCELGRESHSTFRVRLQKENKVWKVGNIVDMGD